MKRYWDSSALIDALHDGRIEKLARESGQFTRPHTLAESFSTLTGGRLGVQYPPDDAVELLREITAGFEFVRLDPAEILDALDEAQKNGVRGGRVHDYLHAVAAKKAGVEQLLTDNYADFAGLEYGFTVAAP
jgi:predicted nucleic acid-binding protein